MSQIVHILKYKFIAFIRIESKVTFSSLLRNIFSGLIYTLFAAGIYLFIQKLFYFLLDEIHLGLFLLHQFISMMLFIFFITINLGNTIVSYSTLYKSNEVNFLFTKPVVPLKIFAIKFLDNIFYSSSTLLMILFSLMAGYAVYFKLSIGALLLLVINFIPFILSAASLGVIILLLFIKLADSFGIKKVIYTAGLTYIVIIVLFFRANSPKSLVQTILKFYPYTAVKDNYFGELISPLLKYLPNNWLSQSGYWICRGNITESLPYLFLQLSLALFLFTAAMILGYRWYFRTWLLNQKLISDLSFYRKEKKYFFSFEKNSFFKGRTEAILKRDLLMFIREPSQVIHSLVLLFLIVVFIASVAGIKFIGIGNIYLQSMIYLSIFLFNLLFLTTLSLRFIYPMLSLEGRSFWKVKSSPIENKELIRQKLFLPSVIILIIGLGLSFFSNYRFGSLLTIFSMTATLFSAMAIISVSFGMGSIHANYNEKNAIRISSSQGASLTFLLTLLYMLFLVIILVRPLNRLFASVIMNKQFLNYSIYWTLIPIAAVSILITVIFIKLAGDSMRRDF